MPVYEITLDPADGLYPLPYMALQADGQAWDGDEAAPFGPPDRARQPFYPDASRVFEEIDRLTPGDDGLGGIDGDCDCGALDSLAFAMLNAFSSFASAAGPPGITAGSIRRLYFQYV